MNYNLNIDKVLAIMLVGLIKLPFRHVSGELPDLNPLNPKTGLIDI